MKSLILTIITLIFISSCQFSNTNIKGNNNNSETHQSEDTVVTPDKHEGKNNSAMGTIDNTNKIVVLLISIGTCIGLIYKGNRYLKKLKKAKQNK